MPATSTPDTETLDIVELTTLKIAIRHGLYTPDLHALTDALLDDPSILDDTHDHT